VKKPLLPSIKDTSFFLIASIVVVLDVFIKSIIIGLPSGFSKHILGSFLMIIPATNFGASFGMLQGKTLFLILFSIVVVVMILLYYRHAPKKTHLFLALILGGTMGNLIDRIHFGYVIDYLAIPHWPTFNLADTSISIGAFFLILYLWKEKEE